MKKLLIIYMIICSCNNKSKSSEIDNGYVENLAKDFMKNNVIPKMQEPKPYEQSKRQGRCKKGGRPYK